MRRFRSSTVHTSGKASPFYMYTALYKLNSKIRASPMIAFPAVKQDDSEIAAGHNVPCWYPEVYEMQF